MSTITIQFRGADLEDVFVYRSSMYAWAFERRLRIYSIADLQAAVIRADPAKGAAVAYWLFHSRGFGSDELQRNAVIEDEIIKPYSLEIDLSSVPYRSVAVSAEAGSVMDMLVYYNTLYLASDGGLLTVDVSANEAISDRVRPLQRIKVPCVSMSGGLGAVAASCGRNGLHILFDTFEPDALKGRKVSDVSLRAELGSATVVNHLSRSEIQFFSGDTVSRTRARGRVLSDVRESTIDDVSRRRIQGASEHPGDFTIWDQSRLVVFDRDGIRSVGVSRDRDKRGLTRSRQMSTNPLDRPILSACRIGSAFVVETPTGLTFMHPDEPPKDVATGPVIGLRSYQRSLRYLRLATATSETGLWLLGFSAKVGQDEL